MIQVNPALTRADGIVLKQLLQDSQDLHQCTNSPSRQLDSTDCNTLHTLAALSDSCSDQFEPVIFTSWDDNRVPGWANTYLLQPYIRWASTLVRKPSDVVYVSHLLILFAFGIPNFVLLFFHFNWFQALAQWMFITYFVGPYSIISHHHIHGRGILSPSWSWLDIMFPYILGPMMGQTWNSFYYHHKHHHMEENGPNDLSSTIRYRRDSAIDLSIYLGRFVFLIWFELPLYYIRKGRSFMGLKFFAWEIASYALIVLATGYNLRFAITALMIPLLQWRIAVMTNNWSQHAFVDEDDPTHAFRSSITLIDVVANRHGLNDGYHTSHHLSPLRHWREHPFAFLKAKQKYADGAALTFQEVDFIKLAILLCRKEYNVLAQCLVPMGDQIGKSNEELASMLRRKTRRFTEEEIVAKFKKRGA